jgi:hypothetical protein
MAFLSTFGKRDVVSAYMKRSKHIFSRIKDMIHMKPIFFWATSRTTVNIHGLRKYSII